MYSNANSERECLWCEQPIQGRADKQFCSSSCKARYNRENTVSPDDESETAASLFRSAPIAALQPARRDIEDEEDDEEQWQVQMDRDRKERQYKEKAQKFHTLYTKRVVDFLRNEGSYYSLEQAEDLLDELDEAAEYYREHPGLNEANHPSHNRLADLYIMRDYMREIRDELLDTEETPSVFGLPEPPTSYLELSKKHRKRLRENLLGEK